VIELNLLPKASNESIGKSKNIALNLQLSGIKPIPIMIVLISIMILCQVILGFFSFMQSRQVAILSKELSDLLPQRSISAALKKEADELNTKFAIIEGLTQGSLIWSKKLCDLSDSMVDGIWLNSLFLEEEVARPEAQVSRIPVQQSLPKQSLVLKGMALSSGMGEEAAIVGAFMQSLKNNKDFFKDFDSIKLLSIQRQLYGKTEVMNFNIVCYFKSDRSYFERLKDADY
jgi:Tfp pilus assembly protein PilN